MDNVVPIAALAGITVTGGRLNVNNSIRDCGAAPEPPAVPTGLVAVGGVEVVSLDWNNATGATSYNVKRSTVSGGPYATIASGVSDSDYVDSSVVGGTTYFYVVSSVNGAGESANSTQASATPQANPPAAPGNLVATPGDGQVVLNWLASAGATSYRVKRSLVKAGPFVQIAEVPGTSPHRHHGGQRHEVLLRGHSRECGRRESQFAQGERDARGHPGAADGSLCGDGVRHRRGRPLVESRPRERLSYKIRRSKVSGGPYKNGQTTSATSFTATGLISGTRYYFVVSAKNALGESGPSIEVSAVAR